MIPKIIHYCWFGKGLMPHSQKRCIEGWKKLMPDYRFMKWDENTFNLNFCSFTSIAYEKGKYAYVSDVARLFALMKYGGIYLDTDVDVYARFDEFLKYDFFTGIELYPEFYSENIAAKYLTSDFSPIDADIDVPKCEILTSTIGSVPGCKIVCEILDYFKNITLSPKIAENFRSFYNYDRMFARYLSKYGFKYVDKTQHLDNNIIVFGTGTFGYPWGVTDNYTVSYHHNTMTWDNENWSSHQKKEFYLDKIGLLKPYKLFKKIKNKLF